MELNNEEEIMFRVMKSIYDAGLPLSFKGSMVLKAVLLEADYEETVRHTIDFDGSWFSKSFPTVEFIAESIQKAIDNAGLPYFVKATRNYGNGRSAGFEFISKETGVSDFTMDMEINKPPRKQRLYTVEGCTFSGVVVSSILADKVFVVSSRKIFRRLKDVFDLYYLSKVVKLDKDDVMSILNSNNMSLGSFHEFLHMKDDLLHAYNKFELLEIAEKIPFNELYDGVKAYIKDFLPVE